ncbi:MAG: hypothetical protein GMKNLPBB_00973 [Myxococcota bacterium]|nr:hypothetical protein [Myxococcota bacterium]
MCRMPGSVTGDTPWTDRVFRHEPDSTHWPPTNALAAGVADRIGRFGRLSVHSPVWPPGIRIFPCRRGGDLARHGNMGAIPRRFPGFPRPPRHPLCFALAGLRRGGAVDSQLRPVHRSGFLPSDGWRRSAGSSGNAGGCARHFSRKSLEGSSGLFHRRNACHRPWPVAAVLAPAHLRLQRHLRLVSRRDIRRIHHRPGLPVLVSPANQRRGRCVADPGGGDSGVALRRTAGLVRRTGRMAGRGRRRGCFCKWGPAADQHQPPGHDQCDGLHRDAAFCDPSLQHPDSERGRPPHRRRT